MVLNYETFRLTFSSYKMHGEHTCNAMIIIFSSAHMRNIVQCYCILLVGSFRDVYSCEGGIGYIGFMVSEHNVYIYIVEVKFYR